MIGRFKFEVQQSNICCWGQPGGLADSSRWLKRSENHRNRLEKILHHEVVPEFPSQPSHLAPRRGAVISTRLTGGLRFAATTGYFLPTLRVASGCFYDRSL